MSKTTPKIDVGAALMNPRRPAELKAALKALRSVTHRDIMFAFYLGGKLGSSNPSIFAVPDQNGTPELVPKGDMLAWVDDYVQKLAKDVGIADETLKELANTVSTVVENVTIAAINNGLSVQRKPEITRKAYDDIVGLFTRNLAAPSNMPSYHTKILSTLINLSFNCGVVDQFTYAAAGPISLAKKGDALRQLWLISPQSAGFLRALEGFEENTVLSVLSRMFEPVLDAGCAVIPRNTLGFLINLALRAEATNPNKIQKRTADGKPDGVIGRQIDSDGGKNLPLSAPTFLITPNSVFYDFLSRAAQDAQSKAAAPADGKAGEPKYYFQTGTKNVIVHDSQIVQTIINLMTAFPEDIVGGRKVESLQNLYTYFKEFVAARKAKTGDRVFRPRMSEALCSLTLIYKPRNALLLYGEKGERKPSDPVISLGCRITSQAVLVSSMCQIETTSRRAVLQIK